MASDLMDASPLVVYAAQRTIHLDRDSSTQSVNDPNMPDHNFI